MVYQRLRPLLCAMEAVWWAHKCYNVPNNGFGGPFIALAKCTNCTQRTTRVVHNHEVTRHVINKHYWPQIYEMQYLLNHLSDQDVQHTVGKVFESSIQLYDMQRMIPKFRLC